MNASQQNIADMYDDAIANTDSTSQEQSYIYQVSSYIGSFFGFNSSIETPITSSIASLTSSHLNTSRQSSPSTSFSPQSLHLKQKTSSSDESWDDTMNRNLFIDDLLGRIEFIGIDAIKYDEIGVGIHPLNLKPASLNPILLTHYIANAVISRIICIIYILIYTFPLTIPYTHFLSFSLTSYDHI